MTEEEFNEMASAFEKVQNEFADSIVADTKLSYYDKMSALMKYKLFGYASWIQHPFQKYATELYKECKANEAYGYISSVDDYIAKYEFDRHQMVNYADLMENYDLEGNPNELVTVATCSCEPKSTDSTARPGYKQRIICKKEITAEQFCKDLYDYAVEHRQVGFEWDW